jgi:Proton-conducting membrane transporter/NADH-Ubiquinone oxidoreductase (complex I), chain 5 N-terminus/LAGLIDADG endonuclease
MYTSIVFLPFLAAIISGLFGRGIGVKGVYIISITCLLITTLLSFIAFYEVIVCNSPLSVELFSWVNSEQLKLSWSFYFDELTVSMLIPVLIVSFLVHLYSIDYMGEDPHQQRFFSYISLFTGLMLILVTGNNFIVMFIGWEGVGICSYLLVHFWYTRIAAVKSAMNAMFTNRVGDYFLTLGFFVIFFTFGSLDYTTVFSLAPYVNTNVLTFIILLLLLGAAAKSAQIGLHLWLPMAMEGPTPVSALIHAATMVTAGVYLLIRCSPLLEQSELALTIILITGAITAFFAASVGLFQNDIKKVIAYSTMSQLARRYNKFIISKHQTICVEPIIKIKIGNSQITKAYNYIYNYNSNGFFNSFSALRQYFLILIYKIVSEKWKIIIIYKLVGISEAIRLILIFFFLKFEISWLLTMSVLTNIIGRQWQLINYCLYNFIFIKMWINRFILLKLYLYINSEVQNKYISNINPILNSYSCIENNTLRHNNVVSPFFEWLAGVIDGDGHFNLSKGGSARLQITMDFRDSKVLYEIKHKLGGTIRTMANANALRYELRHKKGLIALLNNINGLIRNPIRMLQMNKLCVKYGIILYYPKPLTYNNGWLSGFIDSDGSIYFSEQSGQVFVSITQKNKYLLEPLISLYGGRIDILSPRIEAFKYIIYRKNELFNLIDNYFSKYPLKTKKLARLHLIKKFYSVCINKNNQDINKLNEWVLFKDKWEKYSD